MNRRWGLLAVAAAAASMLAACTGPGAPGSAHGSPPGPGRSPESARPAARQAARLSAPHAGVSEVSGASPGAVTAHLARTLFRVAPVVVVADPGPALAAAAEAGEAVHAPLLLGPAATAGRAALAAQDTALAAAVRALSPRAVLAEGLPPAQRRALAALLPGVRLVTSAAALPATGAPPPLSRVAVLVAKTGTATAAMVAAAVAGTARAAGAAVIPLSGGDPRADPAAIAALHARHPVAVVAVGTQFGPAALLAGRVAVAVAGRQLPGGGQLLFPGHRLVALYGHPGTPSLGVLGRQDLPASIARARQAAATYRKLSRVPVVPAFELIATVAEGAPGADHSYSFATPVAELLPWVRRASADGLYVVLDLQPGRASLLAQARRYQQLLEMPDVGLALDPEWKLGPGQQPLRQIGHVGVTEVNSVIAWLSALTAAHRLPQKLLVLHQFQLAMISGEARLDTARDNLAVLIHMDGQGTPGVKQGTWDAVTAAAPRNVYFGWKNFLVKDHPMLTPAQTMTKSPLPVMISYQ